MIKILYNYLVAPAIETGIRLAAPFSEKARLAVEGREGWDAKLETALEKAPSGPRLMLHAPSVGEFLQGRAVLDELLDRRPQITATVTHFSPSAQEIVSAYARAAAHSLLPFDSRRNVKRLLDIVRPDVLIFSRADVWPNLAEEAHRRGIKTALVAGTMSPSAGRLNPLAAGFALEGLKYLDLIAAISEDDAAQFVKIGVKKDIVISTGDPRFDQTWNRAQKVTLDDPLFKPFNKNAPTFVAGSTWPPDEKVVIPAFSEVKRAVPESRMIIAPHEPSDKRLKEIADNLCSVNLVSATLSQLETGAANDPDVVIIDRVGILAKLYRIGAVAFVGGSFVRRVHNVMEPACMGIPVLVGPKHLNAREAQLLIKAGGGFCVNNVEEMRDKLTGFFRNDPARSAAGNAATEFVRSNLGAAKTTAELIEKQFGEIFQR